MAITITVNGHRRIDQRAARHTAALRAARRAAPARAAVRLRARAVRRLLGAAGRQGDPLLRDAGRGAVGKPIMTVEGLGTPEKPHPLQTAFIAEQAAQCGFCTSGMLIMAAASFWSRTPRPDRGADQVGDEPVPVPLRHALPVRRGDPARGQSNGGLRRADEMTIYSQTGRVDRRQFLAGAGALVVAIGAPRLLNPKARVRGAGGRLPDRTSRVDPTQIDSWVAIGGDGRVTIFTGKEEQGTGVATATIQVAADELDVPFELDRPDHLRHLADGRPGLQLRQPVARSPSTARTACARPAPKRARRCSRWRRRSWARRSPSLTVSKGVVSVAGSPSRSVSYASLIGGKKFNLAADGQGEAEAVQRLQGGRDVGAAGRDPGHRLRELHLRPRHPAAGDAPRAGGAAADARLDTRQRRRLQGRRSRRTSSRWSSKRNFVAVVARSRVGSRQGGVAARR